MKFIKKILGEMNAQGRQVIRNEFQNILLRIRRQEKQRIGEFVTYEFP